MKLHFSSTSPFVRKVMACAIARDLDRRIALLPTDPWTSPPGLLADNPLSKVPCLVTDDGVALFDSLVICEYLDSLGDAAPLFPAAGAPRWRALRLHAIADGMLDAGVLRRMEGMRPVEEARTAWIARQRAAVQRGLDWLEAETLPAGLDIGTISLACALGWFDFRFAADEWRHGRPRLAAWFARIAEQPCLARTVPVLPT